MKPSVGRRKKEQGEWRKAHGIPLGKACYGGELEELRSPKEAEMRLSKVECVRT